MYGEVNVKDRLMESLVMLSAFTEGGGRAATQEGVKGFTQLRHLQDGPYDAPAPLLIIWAEEVILKIFTAI